MEVVETGLLDTTVSGSRMKESVMCLLEFKKIGSGFFLVLPTVYKPKIMGISTKPYQWSQDSFLFLSLRAHLCI